MNTPDHLRGRLSGIFILVVTGGPRLGDFEAGMVATWFTPTISVIRGGIACIVGAGVVALRIRSCGGTGRAAAARVPADA